MLPNAPYFTSESNTIFNRIRLCRVNRGRPAEAYETIEAMRFLDA
jgi:hypothetical protein